MLTGYDEICVAVGDHFDRTTGRRRRLAHRGLQLRSRHGLQNIIPEAISLTEDQDKLAVAIQQGYLANRIPLIVEKQLYKG